MPLGGENVIGEENPDKGDAANRVGNINKLTINKNII